jgi:hypothetical protein
LCVHVVIIKKALLPFREQGHEIGFDLPSHTLPAARPNKVAVG